MDQNVGELQRQTSPNYDHSIRHAFAEYSEFSGQKKTTNETPMEIDRICSTKRPSVNNESNSTLDIRRQERGEETKNIVEKDSRERA